MIETSTAIIIALTFLLAGGVKGVLGLGLPTVSLGLLVVVLDLPTAMVLLLIPSFITNVWQALVGGNGRAIVRRIWPFLCLATGMIWFGSLALTTINPQYLSTLLGSLLLIYSSLNFFGFRLIVLPQQEKWIGSISGIVNGILTGMTGSFVVPGVMYLQAIGLPRDQLVQAMGMLFSLSTIGLALALGSNHLLTSELAIVSLFAVVPAIVGMVIGQKIRHVLPEATFRKVFFVSIFMLGIFIICKSYIFVRI